MSFSTKQLQASLSLHALSRRATRPMAMVRNMLIATKWGMPSLLVAIRLEIDLQLSNHTLIHRAGAWAGGLSTQRPHQAKIKTALPPDRQEGFAWPDCFRNYIEKIQARFDFVKEENFFDGFDILLIATHGRVEEKHFFTSAYGRVKEDDFFDCENISDCYVRSCGGRSFF